MVHNEGHAREPTFWNDQFRVAYAQGQASLKLAAVALGKTLFESAEYAARGRNYEQYVYDLYKTFLMREPDASGWTYWKSVVPRNGRVNVRRAFEEAPEFAAILGSIVPNGSATATASSLITARAERRNQPGGGMLARDANWSVSLLSLPGRNGLDLGLGAVNSSTYASDAYRTMSNGRPLIDPRANIFDPRYMPNKEDKYDRENSFSRYFHAIQQLYCTSQPGAERQILY